jgi:hypothetical protein
VGDARVDCNRTRFFQFSSRHTQSTARVRHVVNEDRNLREGIKSIECHLLVAAPLPHQQEHVGWHRHFPTFSPGAKKIIP